MKLFKLTNKEYQRLLSGKVTRRERNYLLNDACEDCWKELFDWDFEEIEDKIF